MCNFSDNELVNKYRDGNVDAFENLCNRYKSAVKSISRAYYLLDGDQDDLFQEGLLGLLKAVNTYSEEHGASFKTFAYMCISSNIKTAVTKSQRFNNEPLNTAVPIPDNLISERTPEHLVIDVENLQEFKEKIKDVLSDYEMKVLDNYLAGLSYVEISEKLSESVKSIDNAVQRIKKKLSIRR